MTDRTTPWTRRQILVGAAAGTTALAGCLGGDSSDDDQASDGSIDGNEDVTRPVKGDPGADVTLEVYTDFACPHCQTYVLEDAETIHSEYTASEQIRYEHRNLPIPVADPESYEAANAARAVFEEGGNAAFWEYDVRLYEEQGRLVSDAPDIYGELATEVGVDADTVQSAGVDQTYSDIISADYDRALELDLGGTPGFILNGDVIGSGNNAVSDVMSAIDDAL
jgi:protein-disulfide isomerase